jgi:hypothetical protein
MFKHLLALTFSLCLLPWALFVLLFASLPSFAQTLCSTGLQPITYNLSENSRNAGEIVWFNSHFKLQGNLPTSDFTVQVLNGTIQFGSSTLTVPNAMITFSSSATCASAKFDTTSNQWETTIPLSAAGHTDEIFAAGLAYVLPVSFPQNVQGVTWTANFTASVQSLQIQWQWGAANYLSNDNKGDVFPMSGGAPDYNAMMVDPGHNVTTCAGYNHGDHGGTPENITVKALVTSGGSGGGGSNWTGSWSSTQSLVCQTQQLQCTPPPTGMVGWWPGDVNANDIVGGNNGTLVGGASFAPGEVGQAFSFDGATGYVQIPSSSALQPPNAISIDAWVNPTAFPPPTDPASVIISKYDSANGGGFSWALLMQPTGQVEWYVIGPSQDPSSQIEVVTVGALSLGAWQHVAATYDTATQAIAVYVNGVQVPTTCDICGTVTSIYPSSANVLIGALISGNPGAVPHNLLFGLIDEVEVFNRALGQSEIQAIYKAGSAGKCK